MASDDLARFTYLYTKQELGNLSPDGPITQEEKAELNGLFITYKYVNDPDNTLQNQIDEIKKRANQKAAEARRAQDRREDSAKDVLHETVNKLAFDKEKKPNLTVASSCYLRKNLYAFIQDSFHKNPLGWSSFICWHRANNVNFPSGMLGYIGDEGSKNLPNVRFLNLSSQDYTLLKPKIRLYKTIVNATGKIESEFEMSFPTDGQEKIATELLMPTTSDAGIKSLNVDFRNQNPFAAGRMVDVQLEMVLSGGEAFTRPRGFKGGFRNFNSKEETYSIRDLLLRGAQLDPSKYDGHHYGIRLVIGYEVPNVDSSIALAVQQNDVSMILQLVEYDLNVQQNGTLSLVLQYKGRVEAQLENKQKYDIFDFKGGTRSEIINTATQIGDADRRLRQLQRNLNLSEKELAEIGSERDRLSAELSLLRLSKPSYAATAANIRMAGGTGDLADAGLNEYQASNAERTKLSRKVEQLNNRYENIVSEINKIKQKIEGENAEKTSLEKEYGLLNSENKVLKYSRILDKLNQDGKVYNIVVNLANLILYGPEFRAALARKIDILKNDASKSDLEKALEQTALETTISLAKNFKNETVRKQIAEQSQGGGSFIPRLRNLIKDKAQEIAGEGNEVSKEQYGEAAAFITADSSRWIGKSGALDGVSATKPKPGTADSDPSLKGKKRIYFFYYGDLLDTALRLNPDWKAQVYTQMESDQNGVIIGPASAAVGDREGRVVLANFNIADVPIPIDLYQEFFNKNIVNKDIDQYNANSFIKDTLYQLVAVFLNQKCTGESVEYPVSVNVNQLAVGIPEYGANDSATFSELIFDRSKKLSGDYGKFAKLDFETTCPIRIRKAEELTRYSSIHPERVPKVHPSYNNRFFLDERTISNMHILRTQAKRVSSELIWNYNMYSLELSSFRSQFFAGDKAIDAARGVHHISLAQDRGLLKSINFSKVKKPGLTEMMVERAHEKKEENIELWSNFSLDLSMIGNSIFHPGMHIYLNPTLPGFGDPKDKTSLSRILGLGGYYMITSVSNTLLPNWQTNVQAKWVSYPITDAGEATIIDDPVQHKTRHDALISNVVILDEEGLYESLGDTLTIRPKIIKAPERKAIASTGHDILRAIIRQPGSGLDRQIETPAVQTGFAAAIERDYIKTKRLLDTEQQVRTVPEGTENPLAAEFFKDYAEVQELVKTNQPGYTEASVGYSIQEQMGDGKKSATIQFTGEGARTYLLFVSNAPIDPETGQANYSNAEQAILFTYDPARKP